MFKNMLNEFKAFAMRGNAIDMAVGIIIGVAFGKVIHSLVNDILMPPIGFLIGKVDFSHLVITLHKKTTTSPAVVISYGAFVNTLIDFIIVALALFFIVKQFNRFSKPKAKPSTTKECPFCCASIPIKATRCPQCTSQVQN